MRIAIFGAGAVGGLIGARLTAAGADPLVVARGATAEALAERGLVLDDRGERLETQPRVASDPHAAGPQDAVVLALKAHQIAPALPSIRPLVGPKTLVVPAINGVPWWYFQGAYAETFEGPDTPPLAGARLDSLDPDGALANAFPAQQLVGCVVYVAAVVPETGTVVGSGPRRLELGAVDSTAPAALASLADTLSGAGLDAPVVPDIRAAVWRKLWGNLWANPLSVATGGTMEELGGDAEVRGVAAGMMAEAERIANRLGVFFPMDIETRIDQGASLGPFKSSMLQDFERGRAIELAAILGAVREIGRRLDIPTPTIDTVHALVRLKARLAGALD